MGFVSLSITRVFEEMKINSWILFSKALSSICTTRYKNKWRFKYNTFEEILLSIYIQHLILQLLRFDAALPWVNCFVIKRCKRLRMAGSFTETESGTQRYFQDTSWPGWREIAMLKLFIPNGSIKPSSLWPFQWRNFYQI